MPEQQQTYEGWIASLKPGDPVRVRFPWEDREVKGGRMVSGTVQVVFERGQVNVSCRRMPDDEKDSILVFTPTGTGTYSRLEHPEIETVYGERGFVWLSELSEEERVNYA